MCQETETNVYCLDLGNPESLVSVDNFNKPIGMTLREIKSSKDVPIVVVQPIFDLNMIDMVIVDYISVGMKEES